MDDVMERGYGGTTKNRNKKCPESYQDTDYWLLLTELEGGAHIWFYLIVQLLVFFN